MNKKVVLIIFKPLALISLFIWWIPSILFALIEEDTYFTILKKDYTAMIGILRMRFKDLEQ